MSKTLRLIALSAAALLSAGPDAAYAVVNTPAATVAPSPASGLWHMLWGLVIVLAVMAAAFWVLKQFTRGGLAGSGPMRTVGTIALGPKERVVLIECNGTWVMVGTAPGRVNALHSMPAPAGGSPLASAAPASASPVGQVSVPPFMRWLDKALQGKAK